MAPFNYWYFDFMCGRFHEYGNVITYGSGDVDFLSIRKHFNRILKHELDEDRRNSWY